MGEGRIARLPGRGQSRNSPSSAGRALPLAARGRWWPLPPPRRRRRRGPGGCRGEGVRAGRRRRCHSRFFLLGSEGLLLTTQCWLLRRPPYPRCSRRRPRPEGRSPRGDRAAARDPTAIGLPRRRGGRERGLRHVTPLFTVPGPRPAPPPRLRVAGTPEPRRASAGPRAAALLRSSDPPRHSQSSGNAGTARGLVVFTSRALERKRQINGPFFSVVLRTKASWLM